MVEVPGSSPVTPTRVDLFRHLDMVEVPGSSPVVPTSDLAGNAVLRLWVSLAKYKRINETHHRMALPKLSFFNYSHTSMM